MKKSLKIVLYYIVAFVIFSVIVFFFDAFNKNIEQQFSILDSLKGIVTSDIKIIVFLTIFSIPLVIYFTGKYIDMMNDETEDLCVNPNLSKEEIKENKEKYKRDITRTQRDYLELGKINYDAGIYTGVVADNHKFKELYVTLNNSNKGNTLVIEQNDTEVRFLIKNIRGLASLNESMIVFDENSIIEEYTKDELLMKGYDIKRIDLSEVSDSNTINLFRYISSNEEIEDISKIIGKNDKYRSKLIETLLYIVKEDKHILNKDFKEVYQLAKMNINDIEMKSRSFDRAYKAFNELILLTDKEKTIVLRDALHVLEMFTSDIINNEEKYFDLEKIKQKATIIYLSVPEVCAGNPIYNALLYVIHNSCNNQFTNLLTKENKKKMFIIIPNLNKFDYMIKLSDKLMSANRNKIFYFLTISNMKEFKSKYVKDSTKIFESTDIKIFYAFRQYETMALLKRELMLDDEAMNRLINELDTSKCLTKIKGLDYSIANIEIPTGIAYEGYSYGDNKNYEAMRELKSIDMKLKVDYLKEFEERQEKEKEYKESNFKPEITREEKEFIAGLLKEREEEENKQELIDNNNNKDKKKLSQYQEIMHKKQREMEKIKAKLERENINRESFDDDETVENNNSEIENDNEKDEFTERIKHINDMQEKMNRILKNESKKAEHALYLQMKNLK